MRMNFANKTISNYFQTILKPFSKFNDYFCCNILVYWLYGEIMDVCGPGSGSDLIEILA